MAFFGVVLFPSPSGGISFVVLPLVSVLSHGTSFILAILFETIRSLFLCRETSRGRLGCCLRMLQWWFCSHLCVITRDQTMRFVSRNRVWAIVSLGLPFFGDTNGWLRYLCSLSLLTRRKGSSRVLLDGRDRPIISVCSVFSWWASKVHGVFPRYGHATI